MEKYNAYEDIIDAYLFMSDYYRDKKQEDSVQYYLEKCVETASINSVVNEKLVTLYNQLAVNASRKKDFSTAKAYQLMVVDAIPCLLYTSDAADERSSVDLGGRRIIKKKKIIRRKEKLV